MAAAWNGISTVLILSCVEQIDVWLFSDRFFFLHLTQLYVQVQQKKNTYPSLIWSKKFFLSKAYLNLWRSSWNFLSRSKWIIKGKSSFLKTPLSKEPSASIQDTTSFVNTLKMESLKSSLFKRIKQVWHHDQELIQR